MKLPVTISLYPAPGPIIDAPFAATPLTAAKSRFESNCQSTEPVVVE